MMELILAAATAVFVLGVIGFVLYREHIKAKPTSTSPSIQTLFKAAQTSTVQERVAQMPSEAFLPRAPFSASGFQPTMWMARPSALNTEQQVMEHYLQNLQHMIPQSNMIPLQQGGLTNGNNITGFRF